MLCTTEMVLRQDIGHVLDEAQSSLHGHQKLLRALEVVLGRHQLEEFFEAFFELLKRALVVYKREPAVERVVDFVAKFAVATAPKCNEDEEESNDSDDDLAQPNFLSLLLNRLLTHHNASDKAVRFRVCQLVAKLLGLAADGHCDVSGHTLDRVTEVMLQRVKDKIPLVRVNAVSALELLQEPVPDCPITIALLSLLAKDSSPDVRRRVLAIIGISNTTLPAVIGRTRDVKEMIRREAFLWLSEKCTIRHLTINQRIQLLRDGLNDPSELVQEACVNGLLRSWSLTFHGDFLALLSRIDVESSPDVGELALKKLFDNFTFQPLVASVTQLMLQENEATPSATPTSTPTNKPDLSKALLLQVVPLESLKCEEAFYWRCMCRYLHGKGVKGEEYLEQIVPTVSEFCDYIERYVHEVLLLQSELDLRLQSEFVVQQLFQILDTLDISDEVGRRRQAKLMCDLLVLPNFPASLSNSVLTSHTKIWPQESYRIEKLLEVIADLRQPAEATLLSATTGGGGGEGEQLSNLSFLELRSDPDTLLRCLSIACELVRELPMKGLNPMLQTLVDALLLVGIQNESPYVRDMAVLCLGLACLLDVSVARKHLLLFIQVSQVDHEAVQATALKVVFDLLNVFGFDAFSMGQTDQPTPRLEQQLEAGDDKEVEGGGGEDGSSEPGEGGEGGDKGEGEQRGETTQRVLNIMANFLEGESSLLREVAGEGIAKLLLSGRVASEKLLAKLLVLWFNPLTQEEDRLRCVLGTFFPAFAAADRSYRQCLAEVFVPVVEKVIAAPDASPLSGIDVTNMADFMIQLTQPTQPNEDSVHDSLAITLANMVLSDPTDVVRIYCRALSLTKLTESNRSNANDLLVLWEKMKQEVVDHISLRYLEKFCAQLKKIVPIYEELTEPPNTAAAAAAGQSREPGSGQSDSATLTSPSTAAAVAGGGEGGGTTKSVKPKPKRTARKTAKKTQAKAGAAARKKQAATARTTGTHRTRKGNRDTSSDEENASPVASSVPARVMSTRVSKRLAAQKIADKAVTALTYSDDDEESDDSLIGDHSPFVRPTQNKRSTTRPLKMLQFSDEDS